VCGCGYAPPRVSIVLTYSVVAKLALSLMAALGVGARSCGVHSHLQAGVSPLPANACVVLVRVVVGVAVCTAVCMMLSGYVTASDLTGISRFGGAWSALTLLCHPDYPQSIPDVALLLSSTRNPVIAGTDLYHLSTCTACIHHVYCASGVGSACVAC